MKSISIFDNSEDADDLGVRERKKRRFRSDVMLTALRIYREEGFPACNVDRIAALTECSRVSIYNYFPEGRDEILQEAYRRITDVYIRNARAAREEATSPRDALIATNQAFFDIAVDPDLGNFFCRDTPLMSTVLIDTMGGGSSFTQTVFESDLKNCVIKPNSLTATAATNFALFLIGAARQAAIKIVERPRCRAGLSRDYESLVDALIKHLNT